MKNKIIYYFLFTYIIFFNYELFPLLAIVLTIYIEISKKNLLSELNLNFYKFITLVFYFSKLVFSLNEILFNYWKKLTFKIFYVEMPFIDMQQSLFAIKCNSLDYNFEYNPFYRSNESWFPILKCDEIIYQTPLTSLLNLNLNIEITTFILSFSLTVFFLKIYFKELSSSNERFHYLIFFLTLSPPVNFLLDRMNVDLFIFISIYFIFQNYYKFTQLKLFFLLLMSFYKLHPIFIILGLMFFFVLKKDLKNSLLHLLAVAIFIPSVAMHYIQSSSSIPTFSNQGLTYGLLSDSEYLTRFLGTQLFNVNQLIIYILLSLLIIILTSYFSYDLKNKIINLNSNIFIFTLFFWYLGTSLYANNDYRLALMILACNWVFNSDNLGFKLSYVLLIFLNPLVLLENSLLFNMDSYNYIDLNFYFFTSYILYYLYAMVKDSYKKRNSWPLNY